MPQSGKDLQSFRQYWSAFRALRINSTGITGAFINWQHATSTSHLTHNKQCNWAKGMILIRPKLKHMLFFNALVGKVYALKIWKNRMQLQHVNTGCPVQGVYRLQAAERFILTFMRYWHATQVDIKHITSNESYFAWHISCCCTVRGLSPNYSEVQHLPNKKSFTVIFQTKRIHTYIFKRYWNVYSDQLHFIPQTFYLTVYHLKCNYTNKYDG